MNYDTFRRNEISHHDLPDGFALDSAPERDFGIHSAVYRSANPEFFQTFLEYGSDLEGLCYCFWVSRNGERVGGVIIRPNHIEGLFVIPPFTDDFGMLAAVKPLLLHWSEKEKDIQAIELLPFEVDLYLRLGFRSDCIRRHLIRPTARFEVTWEDDVDLRACEDGGIDDICRLFAEAFAGGVGQYGRYTQEDYRRRLHGFPGNKTRDTVFGEASTLIYDRQEGHLVAACLVGMVDQVPALEYLAVHPRYRRRKLAKRMIQKALTVLHRDFRLLKVQVFVGNSAEALYSGLGFQPGIERYSLRIPAGTF